MRSTFVPGVRIPETHTGARAWWLAFRGADLLLHADDPTGRFVLSEIDPVAAPLETVRSTYLGTLEGMPVYAAELLTDVAAPEGMEFRGLRTIYGRVDDVLFALAGRASQILEWDRTHQFCGRCGSPMDTMLEERAKRCPSCGLVSFPRLSPAVITLVEDGERALLARGSQFLEGMYALIAGFVEPGESLEEAVAREIYEEVGVEVDTIRYFGSQPWPFPHSIMIGFTARYSGGEIQIDGREIADARWFTPLSLPERVPQKLSIARRIIDDWAGRHGVTIDRP